MDSTKQQEDVKIRSTRGLLSLQRMAEYFDCYTRNGKPATNTIIKWWRKGKLPPPSIVLSTHSVYWTQESIESFVRNGGNLD